MVMLASIALLSCGDIDVLGIRCFSIWHLPVTTLIATAMVATRLRRRSGLIHMMCSFAQRPSRAAQIQTSTADPRSIVCSTTRLAYRERHTRDRSPLIPQERSQRCHHQARCEALRGPSRTHSHSDRAQPGPRCPHREQNGLRRDFCGAGGTCADDVAGPTRPRLEPSAYWEGAQASATPTPLLWLRAPTLRTSARCEARPKCLRAECRGAPGMPSR